MTKGWYYLAMEMVVSGNIKLINNETSILDYLGLTTTTLVLLANTVSVETVMLFSKDKRKEKAESMLGGSKRERRNGAAGGIMLDLR